ncbi:hypothetical protein NERG_01361 [Nematocida ausubeli]|uniref:Uncharacterized protein n=1 Tax=Nematocida ausubeli (strain ATCC PRA-371 / ERTm2) TaxID=1913371 RepID=H8ZCB8_NEMA1|nr:hypothetical protein NERG_01361 [Nematocida ausubeli]
MKRLIQRKSMNTNIPMKDKNSKETVNIYDKKGQAVPGFIYKKSKTTLQDGNIYRHRKCLSSLDRISYIIAVGGISVLYILSGILCIFIVNITFLVKLQHMSIKEDATSMHIFISIMRTLTYIITIFVLLFFKKRQFRSFQDMFIEKNSTLITAIICIVALIVRYFLTVRQTLLLNMYIPQFGGFYIISTICTVLTMWLCIKSKYKRTYIYISLLNCVVHMNMAIVINKIIYTSIFMLDNTQTIQHS